MVNSIGGPRRQRLALVGNRWCHQAQNGSLRGDARCEVQDVRRDSSSIAPL
jgi:hypothetical protein